MTISLTNTKLHTHTHTNKVQCENTCYFHSRMFNNCMMTQLLTCEPHQLWGGKWTYNYTDFSYAKSHSHAHVSAKLGVQYEQHHYRLVCAGPACLQSWSCPIWGYLAQSHQSTSPATAINLRFFKYLIKVIATLKQLQYPGLTFFTSYSLTSTRSCQKGRAGIFIWEKEKPGALSSVPSVLFHREEKPTEPQLRIHLEVKPQELLHTAGIVHFGRIWQ